jgi:hypothetical protein
LKHSGRHPARSRGGFNIFCNRFETNAAPRQGTLNPQELS